MTGKKFSYLISFIMLAFLMLLGGCEESEILFSHAKHRERGLKDCNTCHIYKKDMEPDRPKMAKCLSCHMKNFDTKNPESCLLCHTKPGMKIKVKYEIPKKYGDLKFTHKIHLENKVECEQCHRKIASSEAITPDLIPDMLGTCIPCHKERGKEKIACNICHKSIKGDHMPLYHEDRWVKHDEALWIQRHGNEFYYNQGYCKRCHTTDELCVNCHQDQKPKNHNNTWRRKTHGFAAAWERTRCSVCHQEDFCVRCHESTTPLSHKASWGGVGTRNRHCRNCHFPIKLTNCGVCHPKPIHSTAEPPPPDHFFQDSCSPCHSNPPTPRRNDHGGLLPETVKGIIGVGCKYCH